MNPPRPKSLKELGDFLEGEFKDMLNYDDGNNGSRMNAKVIRVNEKDWLPSKKKKESLSEGEEKREGQPHNTVVIITDREFVKSVLNSREFMVEIYVDGTFSINMNEMDLCRTYVIQAGAYNHVSFL